MLLSLSNLPTIKQVLRLGWLPLLVIISCAQPDIIQPRTRVVLLGTGNPNPAPEREGPAVAIIVSGQAYIVDAGVGLVRRASAAGKLGVTGLEMENLTRVFITHLHSDHTLGLPDLIFTPWVMDRELPLRAFGPPGLGNMVDHLLEAWSEDIDIRINGGQPHTENGYRVEVVESTGGLIYQDSLVKVMAIRVDHGAWPVALAYRFETPDGIIVVSGDATYTKALEVAATGTDLLIHEVISSEGLSERKPDWRAYHAEYHTTSRQLAQLATVAQPRLLVLYHQLFSGVSENYLLKEISSGYSGRIHSGHDLDIIDLPDLNIIVSRSGDGDKINSE